MAFKLGLKSGLLKVLRARNLLNLKFGFCDSSWNRLQVDGRDLGTPTLFGPRPAPLLPCIVVHFPAQHVAEKSVSETSHIVPSAMARLRRPNLMSRHREGAVTVTRPAGVRRDRRAPCASLPDRRHRFPPTVIQHALALLAVQSQPVRRRGYDVEARARGLLRDHPAVDHEVWPRLMRHGSERCAIDRSAAGISMRVFISINSQRAHLRRAVDAEGEVLDILVQKRRDKRAAMKLTRKLLRKQGYSSSTVVTDKLPFLRGSAPGARHAGQARHRRPVQ